MDVSASPVTVEGGASETKKPACAGFIRAICAERDLALTRLETRIGLADYEHFATTTYDFAVTVACFGRFQRGQDFHGGSGFGSYAESRRL